MSSGSYQAVLELDGQAGLAETMGRARNVQIHGQKLAEIRNRLILTQRELGLKVGLSERRIQQVEGLEIGSLRPSVFHRLADVLGISVDELRERICVPDGSTNGKPAEDPDFPRGVKTTMARPAKIVPEFRIGIAANRRVEKVAEHADAHRVVDSDDKRAFVVPVDGDCQHPKWQDGEIVLFSYDAVEREGLQEGKSYYVQFADGTSTFKRVYFDEKDPEIIILRCWNRKKYPKDMRVGKQEVVRIAKAVAKQMTVEE